ncbi:MAG: hypothetical protein ABEI06_02515 [Halobacteriaceae archaeon]
MCDLIEDIPSQLSGGYYDGAKLIGLLEDSLDVEYYHPTNHSIIEYTFDPENKRLDGDIHPEESLRESQTVSDHIQNMIANKDGYAALSDWARNRLENSER